MLFCFDKITGTQRIKKLCAPVFLCLYIKEKKIIPLVRIGCSEYLLPLFNTF
jgi:hypothetical protein